MTTQELKRMIAEYENHIESETRAIGRELQTYVDGYPDEDLIPACQSALRAFIDVAETMLKRIGK